MSLLGGFGLGHPLTRVFGVYLAFFALFFWGIHGGLGHYWDWSFPYFGDQLSNLFFNKSSSWIAADMGKPLDYSSDYFLRFFVSLFGFLPPEMLRYGLFVIIFAVGGLGVYQLARRHTSGWLAFLLGLAAFINPAMFYKYTAGHFNYIVAFVLFVFFLYFMFYSFGKNVRSAVIAGLFFAALGVQIQFFVIGGIFLITFFVFNRDKVAWKYLLLMAVVPVLIHLVWLSNFITGAASAVETSTTAAKMSFKRASASDFLGIFTFSFSKATLLSKFYAFYELLWNALLFIFLLWLLVREKQKNTAHVMLLIFLAIMIFMATGLYQALNLGPVTGLYPMLREVGHFAPIIVLVALLLLARLVQKSTWRWGLMCILLGSLVIVGIKFQYFSQAYSFADVRQRFVSFKEFADKDQSEYRILAYPFFGKYSFNHLPKDPESIFPLKNNGHDSFTTFSHQEYVQNTIAPHEFKESVQYRLLQDYDVDLLRPYNVKYIFDFSGIYESNYDRYVPATVYNNDVSLVKNDPKFFDKLLARNPDKLRKITDHILEVKDFTPRVSATTNMFSLPDEAQATNADSFTQGAFGKPLDYIDADNERSEYTTKLTPLFSDPKKTTIDESNGTFSQKIPVSSKSAASVYINTTYSMLLYELAGDQLTLYTDTPGSLLHNNQTIPAGTESRKVILQIPAQEGIQYYLSFKGVFTPLTPGSIERLGVGKEGDQFEIFAAEGENLLSNGSFESELWREKVSDCNAYDGNAKLGMQRTEQTASEGNASLELSATRHNACTDTTLRVDANTQYLLRFDYQSPNAQTANFFLSYGSDDQRFAKGFRAITDDRWHTATKLVTTPEKAGDARLFLYALEQDEAQATINRYDNLSFVRLKKIQEDTLPAQDNPYKEMQLVGGAEQKFTYHSSDYQYRNLITNPSFERGAWQRTVSDCNNYDSRPQIGMQLDKAQASDGSQSLELEAKRHDACTRTSVNIAEDTDYLLTFDYQTNAADYYGYALSFDDPQTTVTREKLETDLDNNWHRVTVKVRTPARASSLTLYLYAFEEENGPAVIRYDAISLVELPDFRDRFYVAQQPEHELRQPGRIEFSGRGPTQKDIHITSATTPFFLNVSETYSPKWRLALDNTQVNGMLSRWHPTATGTTVNDHFETSGYMNGWFVDPETLCKNGGKLRDGCTKNSDGSYDIRLVAEFAPQRWFAITAWVSWATVGLCAVYLLVSRGRESPTYQAVRKQLLKRGKRR